MSPLGGRHFGRSAALRLCYLAAIAVAVPVLAWNGFSQQLNAALGDIVMRWQSPGRGGAVQQIVIVAIDDQTLKSHGPLPLKRSVLAKALDVLADAAPRVLVLDLMFPDAGEPAEDAALARALARFPRIVLASALSGAPLANRAAAGDGSGWMNPIPAIAGQAALGHVHAEPDADGVVRSVLLAKERGQTRVWALSLQAVRLFRNMGAPLQERGALRLGAVAIPAAEDRGFQMFIHYAGTEGTFAQISLHRLLSGDTRIADLGDKIAIVGVTAQGGGDRLFTPLSSGAGMSGAEIHANAARTILDEAFLTPPDEGFEVLGFALACGVPVLLARRFRGMKLALLLGATALLLPVAAYAGFQAGVLVPLGSLSVLLAGASAVAGAGEYAAVSLELRASHKRQRDYASRVQAMAHEIKTPLTAIQGSSEMISGGTLSEKSRERLAGLIHRESTRLTDLVRTFLDVERMAAGSLDLRTAPVDLRCLCDDVVERARLLAARKKIAIQAEVTAKSIDADGDLLGFAVYNLLSNAVKYSPRGTRIRLSAAEDGKLVRISVDDQGIGIADSERERIFERFYRGQSDDGHHEEGSGIGLALVKEIVVQHGGDIRVESKPGCGSRFTIALPKLGSPKSNNSEQRRNG